MALLLSACGRSKQQKNEITVFCCAALTEVMSTMADSFMMHNDAYIHLNFASSGTLARQLKNGAPADLYVSASTEWMQYCMDQKLIDSASIVPFLQNRLVWVCPKQSYSAKENSIKYIDPTKKIAIGDPEHVPAGTYAREYLLNAGLWDRLESSLIPCRDVKNTLFMVEHAEVDYGLVYQSDAIRSNKVIIMEMVPDSLHTNILMSIALINKNVKAADFFAYLMQESNKPFYQQFGLKTLNE